MDTQPFTSCGLIIKKPQPLPNINIPQQGTSGNTMRRFKASNKSNGEYNVSTAILANRASKALKKKLLLHGKLLIHIKSAKGNARDLLLQYRLCL